MKQINWLSIQPLTGGFMLGAQEAFGCPPKMVISYPGLEDANEKWWIEYYQKKGLNVPYFTWDRAITDFDNKTVTLRENKTYANSLDEKEFKTLQRDIDVVVALPICSALSLASGCFDEHNSGSTGVQNNNMKFITEYTLGTIKPTAYIFENAPALYTDRGEGVRDVLKKLAAQFGYAITFVKTNSNLHDNPQYRERTFAIFWKGKTPSIGFYDNKVTDVVEFLKRVPKSAKHNDPVKDNCGQKLINDSPLYKFMVEKFGVDNYRKVLEEGGGPGSIGGYIVNHGLGAEARKYVLAKDNKCPPSVKTFDRWVETKSFWDYSPVNYGNEKVCTVYFKSVGRVIHPTEERGYTKREFMHFMKLPHDLNIPESETDFAHRIGQNVPVTTGRDWCVEVKKALKDWNSHPDMADKTVYFHNNCKPESSHWEDEKPSKLLKGGFKF